MGHQASRPYCSPSSHGSYSEDRGTRRDPTTIWLRSNLNGPFKCAAILFTKCLVPAEPQTLYKLDMLHPGASVTPSL